MFTVSSVRRLNTKYVYKLKERKGEPFDGTFDENDLQSASSPSVYKLHVLKTRKRGDVTEHFVH